MKIAIYGKPTPNELNAALPGLIARMHDKGFHVAVYARFAAFLKKQWSLPEGVELFTREDVRIDEFAFLVSVGGDGTLLDTATLIGNSGVPVIGINTGRLGFISSATIDEMEAVCDAVLNKNFRVEPRTMLQLHSSKDYFASNNFALNELTVLKKDTAAMIRIDVSLDGEFLNSYWADGLIVSTPTGSTAYSLSCGGPIVVPGSENFIITPIAPHNLNVRPVVVSHKARIGIKVSGRSDAFLLALDSRQGEMGQGETLEITRAPFYLNIIQPPGHSFLSTLRNKMAWGYDKRN
jgi:NAD+ kinase